MQWLGFMSKTDTQKLPDLLFIEKKGNRKSITCEPSHNLYHSHKNKVKLGQWFAVKFEVYLTICIHKIDPTFIQMTS